MNHHNRHKVLIVDDRVENLRAMNVVLESLENIEIVHANSGQEALTLLINTRFALILLDVNMPNMNGYEVADLVSNNPETSSTPIVMITAQGSSESAVMQAYEAGAIDYIVKPVNPVVLLNKVKQFVTLHIAYEETTLLQEEKDAILNAAGEGVIKVTSNGIIQYANSKALEILKCTKKDLLDTEFNHWFAIGNDSDSFSKLYNELDSDGAQFSSRLSAKQTEENLIPIETICTLTGSTNDLSMVMLFQDITERLRLEQRLLHLANYDPLTDLTNRAYFQEGLVRAIARSKRTKGTLALLMLDLDQFKLVNDTLGHDVGDGLLQAVAQRLRQAVRECDIIARLGGDEFAIIVEDLDDDYQSGKNIAEKLVADLAKPYNVGGKQLVVEASIGLAFFSAEIDDGRTLVKCADMALYAAKDAGRNNYQLYAPQMSDTAKQHAEIEYNLRNALINEELTLYYQPQISLIKKRATGFEALVRWFPKGENQAPISPAIFVPIAEQSSLIHVLGDYVLNKACKQLEDWALHCQEHDVTISVNLSAKQLTNPGFMDRIDDITGSYNFDKKYLVFEITETAILKQIDVARKTLNALKDRGFGLSLDDFGTGYSSLSYLQMFPVDCIKIDRCFVSKLSECKKTYALVKAIMAIADSFGLDVVAEGAEELEQIELLSDLHCDTIQGFYFSKPRPAHDIESEYLQLGSSHQTAKDFSTIENSNRPAH